MLLAANLQPLEILNGSWSLSEKTYDSWSQVWQNQIFNYSTSPLWKSLVELGLVLAGISVIYLVFAEGKEVIQKQDWTMLVAMLVWPIILSVSLANNGAILASGVQFITLVGNEQVQKVNQAQMLDYTISGAAQVMEISLAAREQIDAAISECSSQVGSALQSCLKTNVPFLEELLETAKSLANEVIDAPSSSVLAGLDNYVDVIVRLSEYVPSEAQSTPATEESTSSGNPITDGLNNIVGMVNRGVAFPIIKLALVCCQWAFVNTLEAARLLTALSAPIAMGLSLLPLQGRPIIIWLVGYLSLMGLQLGYNIIVGLVANVVLYSQLEAISDVAFLLFLAVFAPGLAASVAAFGGKSLYSAIVSNTKALVDTVMAGISTAGSVALNFIK